MIRKDNYTGTERIMLDRSWKKGTIGSGSDENINKES